MKRQGRSTNELEWKSPTGVWGSYVAVIIIVCCMVSLVVSAALPPVIPNPRPRIETAMQNIIGFIVVFVCWAGHLLIVARRNNVSWRERFLIPLDQLTLPELDAEQPLGSLGTSAVQMDDKIEETA